MIVSSSEKKDRSNLGIMRFSKIIKRSKVFKNSQDGYAPSILNLLVYSLRSNLHHRVGDRHSSESYFREKHENKKP
jgi:hypothetical protein